MDLHLNSTNGTNSPRHLHPMKIAYTVSERQGRSFWTRIGVGYINRDGSINIRLDAMPVSGNLQLRDWTPRGTDTDNEVPPPRHSSVQLDDAVSATSNVSLDDGAKRTADIPF
ncbi:hypothetical protein [Pendulispora albinea]|uniref:Uncharacterized protein n=1 Tax=Pendulispora albinea TaxID=2741071 RepID=A0ABZ2LS82_9BACT